MSNFKRLIEVIIVFLILAIVTISVSSILFTFKKDTKSTQKEGTTPDSSATLISKPSTSKPSTSKPSTSKPSTSESLISKPLTVEILNGVGEKKLAYKIRDYFLTAFTRRLDVLNYENAHSFNYEQTMIIDRRGPFYDKRVSKLQSLTGIELVVYQRYECGVEASIILGGDWEKYFPDVVKHTK